MENQTQKKQYSRKYIKAILFLMVIHMVFTICKLSGRELVKEESMEIISAVFLIFTFILFSLDLRERLTYNKENTIQNLKETGRILLTRILFFGGLFAVLYYFLHRN